MPKDLQEEQINELVATAIREVTITDVKKISRSEALELVRQMGRNWDREKDFRDKKTGQLKSVNNPGSVDLLELSYADMQSDRSGRLFVGYTYTDEQNMHDFTTGDVISVFFHKKKPTFVYNHDTHYLVTCFDIKDINITLMRGVVVRGKSHKTTAQIARAITQIQSEGTLTTRGELPRAQSFDGEPGFSFEKFRAWHDFINISKKVLLTLFILFIVFGFIIPLIVSIYQYATG